MRYASAARTESRDQRFIEAEMSAEDRPSTSSQGSRPRKRKRSESVSKDDKEPLVNSGLIW